MEGQTLARPPWLFAASSLAFAVGIAEVVILDLGNARLFRAVLIADASIGWVPLFAALQGLRAVPWPPAAGWIVLWVVIALRWLMVLLTAFFIAATAAI